MKKNNIVELNPSIDGEVIDTLEWLLEGAKQGRLNHIACVYAGDQAETGLAFAGGKYPAALLGLIEVLKQDLIKYHF